MKKVLGIILAISMLFVLMIPSITSAAQSDALVLQCTKGDISGEAALPEETKHGVQNDYTGQPNMIGLSGTSSIGGKTTLDDGTVIAKMPTTVTFKDVDIKKDGNYSFTLAYDTCNDNDGSLRKVDLLIDGVRYNYTIDTTVMAWRKGVYFTVIYAPLTAGKHTIAVTTSSDFDRSATPVVKSVNVGYLTIQWESSVDQSIVLQSINGEISGEAALESKKGVQNDYTGNPTTIGLSGASTLKDLYGHDITYFTNSEGKKVYFSTMDTTVTFKEVDISKGGNYSFTLSYDTCNDATRKVDLLVDNMRYHFTVDTTVASWRLALYNTVLTVPLTAGKHTIALTTSLDFNRDSANGPVVKSVNVGSLTIKWASSISTTSSFSNVLFSNFNSISTFTQGINILKTTTGDLKDYNGEYYDAADRVKDQATLSIVEGKGIGGSKALSISKPCSSGASNNVGVNIYSTNNMPTYIKGEKYLVVWVDFTNVELRKACFGLLGKEDNRLYRTDDLDNRNDLHFYMQDGNGGWVQKEHGADGCFGSGQGTPVMGYKGYMAFPISDFATTLSDKTTVAFNPETQTIAGVYFYFKYNYAENPDTALYSDVPFYFDNLQFMADYTKLETSPSDISIPTTAAPTTAAPTTTTAAPAFTAKTLEAEDHFTNLIGVKDTTGVTCIATGKHDGADLMRGDTVTLPKGAVYKVVFYIKLISVGDITQSPAKDSPVLAYHGNGNGFDTWGKIFINSFLDASGKPNIDKYVAIEKTIDTTKDTADRIIDDSLFFANDSTMSVKVDKMMVMLASDATPAPTQDPTTPSSSTPTTASTATPRFEIKTFEAENAPCKPSATKDATGIIGSPSSVDDHIIFGNNQTLPKGASYKLVIYAKLLNTNCVGDNTKRILNYDGGGTPKWITGADFPAANTYYAIEVPLDLRTDTNDLTIEVRFWFAPASGATVKIDKVMLMLSSDPTPAPVQDPTTPSSTASTTVSTAASTQASETASTTASTTVTSQKPTTPTTQNPSLPKTNIMFTDFNNLLRFQKGVDTYMKSGISPNAYKDYFADNYNGVPTLNIATLSIVDGKGVNGSRALSIKMPHQEEANDNIGVQLFASSINNMPTSIKGTRYLVLWVDFTGVDFRKACFGLIGKDLTLYRTDELDDRNDLTFYIQDGNGGWIEKVHGDDGCFGVREETSVLDYKGYMAIPISGFGSVNADENAEIKVFDPETQEIAGVYFYFDYNGASYSNKPFYFDNIQFLSDYHDYMDVTPVTTTTTQAAGSTTMSEAPATTGAAPATSSKAASPNTGDATTPVYALILVFSLLTFVSVKCFRVKGSSKNTTNQ